MNRSVGRYISLRVLAMVPVLLGTSLVTFVLTHVLGNPVYAMLGAFATPTAVAETTHELGLDRPLFEQYWTYLQGLVHGDLGTSLYTGRPVMDDLLARFPVTLQLISLALGLALLVGVGLGLVAAWNRHSLFNRVVRVVTVAAISIPSFWLGLILIYVFFFRLHWAAAPIGQLPLSVLPPPPKTGMLIVDSLLAGNIRALQASAGQLILPVITIAFGVLGPIPQQTRTAAIEVLDSEFIYYARSCGLPARRIAAYVIRNSFAPVLTLTGVLYGLLVGGAALVEFVFAWGGLGQYGVQAMVQNDIPAIQGVVQLTAAFSIVVYLVVDLLHLAIDPRVAYR
jgi:ABC-type dipeptide/oligopeptide/nickel transport system permease component